MSGKKTILKGDRIYACLQFNGNKIAEFIMEEFGNFGELLNELHRLARHYCGLAHVVIRNITRGWSLERPMMLYPAEQEADSLFDDPRPAAMQFPWQTH